VMQHEDGVGSETAGHSGAAALAKRPRIQRSIVAVGGCPAFQKPRKLESFVPGLDTESKAYIGAAMMQEACFPEIRRAGLGS